MKRIKKKVNKILLSLTMVLTMTLTMMPATLHAANAYVDFISAFTIVGTVGEEIEPVEIVITTTSGNWGSIAIGADYTSIFIKHVTNFPGGLKATVAALSPDKKVLTLNITGKPTAALNGAAVLKSSFEPNPNCIFNIKEAYQATVNYGTTNKAKYAKDETVTITANTPAAGKLFKEWTVVSGAVTFANSKSATTTFTMPDIAVEVTATYEDILHIHTASATWSKDVVNHWHECTANDGEKMDLASHTFGEWVIDTKATETTKGSKHRDCTVCGQRETVEIPVIGKTPAKPSSPKTGDTSSTMLYLGLIVLSGCAAGFGIKKKMF